MSNNDEQEHHQRWQQQQQDSGQQHERIVCGEGEDVEAEDIYNKSVRNNNNIDNEVAAVNVPPPNSAAATLIVEEEIIEHNNNDNDTSNRIDPTMIKGDIIIPSRGDGGTRTEGRILDRGSSSGSNSSRDDNNGTEGNNYCHETAFRRHSPPRRHRQDRHRDGDGGGDDDDGDIDTMQTPSSLYSLSTQRQVAAAPAEAATAPPPLNYQLNQGKRQSTNNRAGTSNGDRRGGGGGGYFEGSGDFGDGSFVGSSSLTHRQQQKQERATTSRPGAFTVRGIATGDIPAWAWRRTSRRRRDYYTEDNYVDDIAMNLAIQESYRQQRERLRQEKTQKLWKGRMLGFLLVCLVAAFVIGVSILVSDKQNQQQQSSSNDDDDGRLQPPMTNSGEDYDEDEGIKADTLQDVPFVYYDDDVVESRWTSIRDSIEYFTHFPRSIDNPLSPQRKALDWLVHDDEAKIDVTDIHRLATRYGLAVLYFATNGFQWYNRYQFLSPLHECNWTSSYNTSTATNRNTTAGSNTRSTTSSWMSDTSQQGVICNFRDQVDALFLGTNFGICLLLFVLSL